MCDCTWYTCTHRLPKRGDTTGSMTKIELPPLAPLKALPTGQSIIVFHQYVMHIHIQEEMKEEQEIIFQKNQKVIQDKIILQKTN